MEPSRKFVVGVSCELDEPLMLKILNIKHNILKIYVVKIIKGRRNKLSTKSFAIQGFFIPFGKR